MKLFSILLLVTMIVSGCVSRPKVTELYKLPQVEQETAATVYMFANSDDIYPLINGKMVAHLEEDEYITFDVPEGEYMLGYAYPINGDSSGSAVVDTLGSVLFMASGAPHQPSKGKWGKDMERLKVEAGSIYYYAFSTPSLFREEFLVLENDEAKVKLTKSKLVPSGHFSEKEKKLVKVIPLPKEFLPPYN